MLDAHEVRDWTSNQFHQLSGCKPDGSLLLMQRLPTASETLPHISRVPAAGFAVFLVLTVLFYSAPPTPLSVSGHVHVNKLVMDVQHQLASVRSSVGKNLQHFQFHLPTLHALQDSLTQLADVLHHRVDDLVHILRDDVAASAAALREGLGAVQGGMHALSDSLQHQMAQLLHATTGSLSASLARVVQWPTPRWPVYVYMAGTMACLLASTVCHLLGCCSQHVSQLMWRFDYAGIAALIIASFIPTVYYTFMCMPALRFFYLTLISIMGEPCCVVRLAESAPRARMHACMRCTSTAQPAAA